MPTSHTRQIVSNHNGQKRINLRVALETQQHKISAVDMTFGELARAYLAVHYNGADMQLRKWIDLLDSRSAWEVSAEELARAGIAMIDNGYSPSTVNRNLSRAEGQNSHALEGFFITYMRSKRGAYLRRIDVKLR